MVDITCGWVDLEDIIGTLDETHNELMRMVFNDLMKSENMDGYCVLGGGTRGSELICPVWKSSLVVIPDDNHGEVGRNMIHTLVNTFLQADMQSNAGTSAYWNGRYGLALQHRSSVTFLICQKPQSEIVKDE